MATLSTLMQDIADAIREKKGVSESINPQDFASEIASIEGGCDVIGGVVNRVSYLRRTNEGYINTGINGANNNLKIKVQYALRTLPTGYWSLIYAYADENTNTTRIILNKNTQVLGSINSKASGGGITATRTSYENIIYTDVIEPTSSTSFKLNCNGVVASRTRANGNTLDKNILIFSVGSDTVDIELYKCEIYDGDTLIRDFVPCIRGTEYGLWDVVTETFYGNAGNGEFSGEVINLEEVESPQSINIKWTGHADVDGLKAIGWTEEDIAYYQQHGVNWNEEDDQYHLVSDENKAMYGVINADNIADFANELIYLPKIDTSGRTSFASWLIDCGALVAIPMIDTSSATTAQAMCEGCGSLCCFPPLDFSNVTSISRLFYNCGSLTYIPPLNTSKATNWSYFCRYAYALQTMPDLDTSVSTNFNYAFSNCNSLSTVRLMDVGKGAAFNETFGACKGLRNIFLKGLNKSLSLSGSPALTKESLLYIINNAKTSAITITLSAYSYTKYSEDADVVAALANKSNISLASA